LKQMADEVKGPVFFQPHRSYLIHLGYVTDYNNKTITMENRDEIPISRNKLSELKTALIMYIRSC
ncbi:MAG: LytTR family DNA-binding domain-containing protein, partial [Bacillota bacterium]